MICAIAYYDYIIFQHRLLENESLVKIHQRYWINIDSMMVLMLIFGWEEVNRAMDQSRLVSSSLCRQLPLCPL